MEDIFDQKPKTPIEEAWHKEQERKKYDIIRVKNPTNEDMFVMYDVNQYQKIPANSNVDIPRYIATRYITHMKDKIIHSMSQKMHDDLIKEKKEKGQPAFKSKWEENEETYSSSDYPKTNDPKIMADVIGELWLGLVYEFGRDMPPAISDPRSGEVNLTPPEMQILEGLEKRRVAPQDRPPEVFQPVYTPAVEVIPQIPSPFADLSQKLEVSDITNE